MNEQRDTRAARRHDVKSRGGFAMWRRSFHGPLGWTAVLILIEAAVLTIVIILTIIWLARAETVRGMIAAAAALIAAVIVMAMIKVYSWLLMFYTALADRLDLIDDRLGGK